MEKLRKLLAVSLVILVAFAGLAIEFNSITAKKQPGYWKATLPINYHAKDQLFFFLFTDFETKKLHWSTVTGPPNPLAVAFDVDYVKTTGSKLGPWDENPWFDLYAEALRLKLGSPDFSNVLVEVQADKATLQARFHDPDLQGVVGTLIGNLTGKVKVLVNYPAPGIQLPVYQNSEFTFKWTFVEPNYSVELSTYDLELPIGEPRTVTVTVKNTTLLSQMVWLQVDAEDLKKKGVGVGVEYDGSPFLPTTEGISREVTITASADPMKLPITGTIRISVDGYMMFGWPAEDRAAADLTVTVVPKPKLLELSGMKKMPEITYTWTFQEQNPDWPDWTIGSGSDEGWRWRYHTDYYLGHYNFNVDLNGLALDENYVFTYTVDHIYMERYCNPPWPYPSTTFSYNPNWPDWTTYEQWTHDFTDTEMPSAAKFTVSTYGEIPQPPSPPVSAWPSYVYYHSIFDLQRWDPELGWTYEGYWKYVPMPPGYWVYVGGYYTESAGYSNVISASLEYKGFTATWP